MADNGKNEDQGDYTEQILSRDANIIPMKDRTNLMHLVVNPSQSPL